MLLTTPQQEAGGPDSDTSSLKSTQGESSKRNLPKDNVLNICEPPATYSPRHKRLMSMAGSQANAGASVLPLSQRSHNTFSRPSRILTPCQVYIHVIWERNHHYQEPRGPLHTGTSAPRTPLPISRCNTWPVQGDSNSLERFLSYL